MIEKFFKSRSSKSSFCTTKHSVCHTSQMSTGCLVTLTGLLDPIQEMALTPKPHGLSVSKAQSFTQTISEGLEGKSVQSPFYR